MSTNTPGGGPKRPFNPDSFFGSKSVEDFFLTLTKGAEDKEMEESLTLNSRVTQKTREQIDVLTRSMVEFHDTIIDTLKTLGLASIDSRSGQTNRGVNRPPSTRWGRRRTSTSEQDGEGGPPRPPITNTGAQPDPEGEGPRRSNIFHLLRDITGVGLGSGNLTVQGMIHRAGQLGKDALFKGQYGRIAQGISGAVGLGVAAPAIYRTQSTIEGMFHRGIAGDIYRAQQYGLSSGDPSMQTLGTGITNKLLEPLSALGIPVPFIGSEGQRFAFRDRADTFRATLNPFDGLSIQDDRNIKNLVRGRGFRVDSDDEREAIQAMRDLKKRGLDPAKAIDYIDLYTKKFGQSAEQSSIQLDSFRDRAQQAGKGLDEYVTAVTNISKNLLDRGVRPVDARIQAELAASIPGVDGEQFASITATNSPKLYDWVLRNDPNRLEGVDAAVFAQNPASFLGDDMARVTIEMTKEAFDEVKARHPDVTDPHRIATLVKMQYGGTFGNVSEDTLVRIAQADPDAMDRRQAVTQSTERAVAAWEALSEGQRSNLEKAVRVEDFERRVDAGHRPTSFENREILKSIGSPELAEGQRILEQIQPIYDDLYDTLWRTRGILPDDRINISQMIRDIEDPRKIYEQITEAERKRVSSEESKTTVQVEPTPRLEKFLKFIEKEGGSGAHSRPRTNQERNTGNLGRDMTDLSRLIP